MGVIASAFAVINKIISGKIEPPQGSVYDFSIKTLDGSTLELKKFQGKKMLLVNTASRCAYTPQYDQLQELHEKYSNKIAVVGFPANDFLWQEPGGDEKILAFCTTHFGVQFPVSQKVKVTGVDAHPLFKWLAGKTGTFPTWNFCKYLVDEKGDVVQFYNSKVSPLDNRIISAIT
jgi:glutathione peroxidase